MKKRNTCLKYNFIFSFYILISICLFGCYTSKKHFVIGRDPNWESIPLAPAIMLTAFTNEVVNKMEVKKNLLIAIENSSYNSLFSYLDQDKTQGIFINTNPKFIDLEKYSLSFPLVKTGPVLIVSSRSPYSSLKDLKNKFIAVFQYDNSIGLIGNQEDYMIGLYEDPMLALQELQEGFYDGVLVPSLKAYSLVSSFFKGDLKIITPPMGDVGIYLVTKKNNSNVLLRAINSIVGSSNKSSKTFENLKEKYQLKLY